MAERRLVPWRSPLGRAADVAVIPEEAPAARSTSNPDGERTDPMRRQTKVFAVLAAFALLGAACGDDDDGDEAGGDASGSGSASAPADSPDGPAITVGGQDFGESLILTEIYAGALDDAGYEAEAPRIWAASATWCSARSSRTRSTWLPTTWPPSSSSSTTAPARPPATSTETFDLLTPLLEERDLVGGTPSDAVDTNAFVVTEETSDELGITTLSDLAYKGADLTLGAPPDCETNGFCIPGLQRVYGVDLSPPASRRSTSASSPTPSTRARSTWASSAPPTAGMADESTGWVLLEDDQSMFAADNVFPVYSQEVADAYGDDLAAVLDEISAELTTEDLIEMNKRYDVDRDDADDIAEDWLDDHGFGEDWAALPHGSARAGR